jgi:hypothetical protein
LTGEIREREVDKNAFLENPRDGSPESEAVGLVRFYHSAAKAVLVDQLSESH